MWSMHCSGKKEHLANRPFPYCTNSKDKNHVLRLVISLSKRYFWEWMDYQRGQKRKDRMRKDKNQVVISPSKRCYWEWMDYIGGQNDRFVFFVFLPRWSRWCTESHYPSAPEYTSAQKYNMCSKSNRIYKATRFELELISWSYCLFSVFISYFGNTNAYLTSTRYIWEGIQIYKRKRF